MLATGIFLNMQQIRRYKQGVYVLQISLPATLTVKTVTYGGTTWQMQKGGNKLDKIDHRRWTFYELFSCFDHVRNTFLGFD